MLSLEEFSDDARAVRLYLFRHGLTFVDAQVARDKENLPFVVIHKALQKIKKHRKR